MKRTHFYVGLLACLAGLFFTGIAQANSSPYAAWTTTNNNAQTFQLAQTDEDAAEKTSGQGDYKFRVLYTSSHLPEAAQEHLVKAHGGFAIDRRKGKGETYFALPGAGILRISSNLKKVELLDTPDEMLNTNMHNAAIWYDKGDNAYLGFPANDANKIFVTDLKGKLLATLDPPTGSEFAEKKVARYFEHNEKFIPTDLDELNGLLYITTGYSSLDYVLTATIDAEIPTNIGWNNLVFGGKGDKPGQFGTGHGVTINPERNRVDVADRPVAELDRFTPEGAYLETVNLPAGAFPCDIDFEAGYMLVGCLHGEDREAGAPIYLLKDDKVISSIVCKRDLGLENFQHVHNAAMRVIDGTIYILAQAWNPGDFVILEQVK